MLGAEAARAGEAGKGFAALGQGSAGAWAKIRPSCTRYQRPHPQFSASAALASEVEQLRGRIQQFHLGEVSSSSFVRAVTPSDIAWSPASPARRMRAKIAGGVGLSAGAVSASDWEEFQFLR